jgi:hypothetical protein
LPCASLVFDARNSCAVATMPVWIGGLKQKRKKQRKRYTVRKSRPQAGTVWCGVVSCRCAYMELSEQSKAALVPFQFLCSGEEGVELTLVNPKATTVRQWRWPASRPPCFILPLLSPHATNPQANASNRDRGKGDSTVDYQTNPPVCLSPHVCARPLTCIYISNSVSLQRRRKQRITFPCPHRVAFVAFLPPGSKSSALGGR